MSVKDCYPILEFDNDATALIEPQRLIKPLPGMPKSCVICFFQDVIEHLLAQGLLRDIYACKGGMGRHPIYEMACDDGRRVALFHPGIGAPMAVALLEEVIALGCTSFVACGGAGVLDKDIAVGRVLVPTAAVRHEGTSYHYLPPSREVSAAPGAVAAIEEVLHERRVPYARVKTWTTDAVYRETRTQVSRRRAEGCSTVEMEAAALFAVARFRGVALGQILYAGDDLGGDEWDKREWASRWPARELLVHLAVEACQRIAS